MHFLEWKPLNFKEDFTEICSLWSSRQYGSTGSDNGLALTKWQAIIWTNDGLGCRCIYVSLGLSELIMSLLGLVMHIQSLILPGVLQFFHVFFSMEDRSDHIYIGPTDPLKFVQSYYLTMQEPWTTFKLRISLVLLANGFSKWWDRQHIGISKLSHQRLLLSTAPLGTNLIEVCTEMQNFSRKHIWKCCLQNFTHFILRLMS